MRINPRKHFFVLFMAACLLMLPLSSLPDEGCSGCRRGAKGGKFRTQLFEIFASPCFFVSGADLVEKYRGRGEKEGWGEGIKPGSYSVTEYLFDSSLKTNLGGQDTFMEHGKEKKVESSLSISLYYDGDEQILVKTWTAQSPINSMESLYNRMFDNPDA
ncbi:MAG: hypothetical protein GF421_00860, partial [Candidatus Aminicenantes bacterium]|nr:hypothetical protein [Candidatus Aminicenantes bacterium]